ncbi:Alpha/Beta hydrolase protein [Cokeromyces recurvatus]|uniref:Alpha/Beta hydrolase protein n=1 Tax=Cokeromyces recurvatus TaxID=90255 RepID=UPI00221FEFE6|nr:Alpha/Beta hydrolase protein [Cokeromyces recurvatus]KAI7901394.1 Alpha/Beta hydrolase protein [Cokeromyces recurvatus]
MIQFWNYNYEEHYVRTQDQYLLCLHRIKEPKHAHHFDTTILEKGATIIDRLNKFNKTKRYRKGKPVVLLYHGLTLTSEVWISNIKEQRNLALYLVEHGYDVWMGNARGNKYSQSHLTRNPKNDDFWEFSINEFAMFDMPDTINYILKQTGAPSLTYIGFSQGTAQAFAALSIDPDLNEKVNLFIALAPAASPKGFSHPLIDGFVKAAPSIIYSLLGRKIFLKSVVFWQRVISPPLFVKLIDGAVCFLFGWHCKNMTEDQKLVSYQHLFSMTSVKSIVHWFQIISSGRFQMYDETPSILPYSTINSVIDHLPAKFPTKQIKTPIAIFYGSGDTLVDIDILQTDLPPLAYVKNIHGWEHMDFLWATHLEKQVFPDIIKLLDYFNSGSKHEEVTATIQGEKGRKKAGK